MTKIILCIILGLATVGSLGFAFLALLADGMADDHIGGDPTPTIWGGIGLVLLALTILEVWKG